MRRHTAINQEIIIMDTSVQVSPHRITGSTVGSTQLLFSTPEIEDRASEIKTRNRRPRRSAAELSAMRDEALSRAESGRSACNYHAIIAGFIDKGIPADQIQPRVNVFTFAAWKALGRHVRKGEHGVKVITWIDSGTMREKINPTTGEKKLSPDLLPRTATVFHVTQTDPDNHTLED
jgi:hypothetical protein